MALLAIVDFIIPELMIVRGLSLKELSPLFWTTVIIWLISSFIFLITKKEDRTKQPKKEETEK